MNSLPKRSIWMAAIVLGLTQLCASGAALAAGLGERSVELNRARFSDTLLQTHDGRELRFYSDLLHGRSVVIHTIYTSCLGSCPLVTRKLKEVRERLTPDLRERLLFLTISIDPERDTPEKMREFGERMGLPRTDNWVLLTGDRASLSAVLGPIGYRVEDFSAHSLVVQVANLPAGRWGRIASHLPPESIATRIRQIVGDG